MRVLGAVASLALASCLTQRADVDPVVEQTLEVVREKDREGHLVREQMVIAERHAKPISHGTDKGWYANGSKRYEREFDHGVPKGVWRTWHANGQVQSETTFGADEAVMRFWYDSGVLSAEGPAQNGSRQGVWRFNRPDGSLREEGAYADSLRNGEWTQYSATGEKTRVVYVRGVVVERQ